MVIKKKKIILLVLIILFALFFIFYLINVSRANNKKDPVFYFHKEYYLDGGSTIYNVGIYKIIKYKSIYSEDVIYKIGGLTMKFENPFDNS